jgi:hypothetical protein
MFLEDYMDILNIGKPHLILKQLTNSNLKKPITSSMITNKMLNGLFIRENYSWKKSFTTKTTKAIENSQSSKNDEKLNRKLMGQYELVAENSNLLDLFEQKFSCPSLSLQETYDIFYSNGRQFDLDDDECFNSDYEKLLDLNNRKLIENNNEITAKNYKRLIKKQKKYLSFKLNSLNQFDENNVCINMLKRLYLTTKMSVQNQKKSQDIQEDSKKLKLKHLLKDDSFTQIIPELVEAHPEIRLIIFKKESDKMNLLYNYIDNNEKGYSFLTKENSIFKCI